MQKSGEGVGAEATRHQLASSVPFLSVLRGLRGALPRLRVPATAYVPLRSLCRTGPGAGVLPSDTSTES